MLGKPVKKLRNVFCYGGRKDEKALEYQSVRIRLFGIKIQDVRVLFFVNGGAGKRRGH